MFKHRIWDLIAKHAPLTEIFICEICLIPKRKPTNVIGLELVGIHLLKVTVMQVPGLNCLVFCDICDTGKPISSHVKITLSCSNCTHSCLRGGSALAKLEDNPMPASFKYKIQQVSSFDLPSHGLTLVFFKVDFENSIVQKTWPGSGFWFAISEMVLKVLQKSDKGQFFYWSSQASTM